MKYRVQSSMMLTYMEGNGPGDDNQSKIMSKNARDSEISKVQFGPTTRGRVRAMCDLRSRVKTQDSKPTHSGPTPWPLIGSDWSQGLFLRVTWEC